MDEKALARTNVDPATGCWEWQGAVQGNGYGRLGRGGSVHYAHRYFYTIYRGPIPEGMDIDHLCRNRKCVNPDHLEAVSRSENLRRGDSGKAAAAINKAKTHCPRGHAYDDENTRHYRGRRCCRACAREKAREAQQNTAIQTLEQEAS